MNDQFDELAKGLAQSVTRRGALKKFCVGLAGLALATLFAGHAHAADVYVDANAAAGGDGNIAGPFRRITEAVESARFVRQSGAIPAGERIVIHVAAGNYIGTFNATPLGNNANREVLPILLNVPNLTLAGATLLDHDAQGLPTGPANGPQTTLKSSEVGDGAHQALLLICRTTDSGVGDGVTVSGFTFSQNQDALGMVVDRVSDFTIRDNAFLHASIGTITRLASGIVAGNFYFQNSAVGPGIGGGSLNHPARVTLSGNRSTGASGGADIRGEPSMRSLDLGANTLRLVPLQVSYDRNDPQDAANLPDTLEVAVHNNDFSGNKYTGLWCVFYANNPMFGYTTKDATQLKTSVIRATIRDNTCTGNYEYGFAVDPVGTSRAEPRTLTASFSGSFQGNLLQNNGRSGGLFDFIRAEVSRGVASIQDYKFLQNATYDVTDFDGELAGFDYDSAVTDPFSGALLNNTLTVNGATVPAGTKITSLKK